MRKIFLAGFAACVALGAPANAPAQNQIEAGEQVYEEHCTTCHGVKLRRTGAIPNLKEQKSDGRARFDQMVMAGAAGCRRGRASSVANSTSCGPTLGRAHTTGKVRRPMWVDVMDDASWTPPSSMAGFGRRASLPWAFVSGKWDASERQGGISEPP